MNDVEKIEFRKQVRREIHNIFKQQTNELKSKLDAQKELLEDFRNLLTKEMRAYRNRLMDLSGCENKLIKETESMKMLHFRMHNRMNELEQKMNAFIYSDVVVPSLTITEHSNNE